MGLRYKVNGSLWQRPAPHRWVGRFTAKVLKRFLSPLADITQQYQGFL
jgi:hypothetical protein